MKKKIAILGSTGSIGKSLIEIIKKDKKKFKILLLAANRNYKELFKQAKIFNVNNIIIKDEKSFKSFLLFSFYSAYQIRDIEGINSFILLILICVFTDIGGYIFGKFFKGPKLIKISPNKTYAGVLGGFLLAVVASLIYINYINLASWFIFPLEFLKLTKNYETTFLIFVLIISLVSQVGDLIISYFKRLAKIKPSILSNIPP